MQEVSKRFGATRAMDHVSFELAPRELLALVGPSGCGKSTTLRVAAGLLAADEGSVRLSGQLVDDSRTHVPPERRRIGLVFQEHALFPHLTVGRNVAFGIRGQPRAAVRHRVVEMLEMVGLAGMADRYPHELSGGERQRVALARSLAPEPALLLLDEPFASLDPNLRTKVRTEVVDILHHTGTPTMFVTHDQGEALAVGDRVAVMRAGRIEQIGEPVQVFHRPANRFVAAFMGEADFLDLDDPLVRAAGTVEAGETPVPHTGPIGGPGVAMVRPDDITFEVDTGGDTEILGTEFRGSSWCYTLALPSGTVVRSLRSHLAHVPAGTKVRATIKPGHRPVVVPDDAAVD